MSTQQQDQITQPDCVPAFVDPVDLVDSVAPDPKPLLGLDAGSDPAPTQEDAITCMYNSLILLRIALKDAIRRRLRGTPE